MGHLRETTQQFSQFKSSLWTLCAKIAAANSIFSPSAISVRPLSPYPRTSHSELQVQNPAFASCLLEGIAFCWRFCQTWTSSLFAISAPCSFWLSQLDHQQHFWRLVIADFSNRHILRRNCGGRIHKCGRPTTLILKGLLFCMFCSRNNQFCKSDPQVERHSILGLINNFVLGYIGYIGMCKLSNDPVKYHYYQQCHCRMSIKKGINVNVDEPDYILTSWS